MIDTMWLEAIFTREELSNTLSDALDVFADALDKGKILGISSVVSLAERAGELHWKYEVPTADSLIAATGMGLKIPGMF